MIGRTDIPGVDLLVRWAPFAVLLTVFVLTGVANAINIINGFNGFNGLAPMCVLMMMLALGYVAIRILQVCHCYREEGNVIRIISARKATSRESNAYP